VETVHQIGGDGLEAFGVAADVLLEQGQEWRQCRILLCCVWADALQHHLTIGAEGVADAVALAQPQGPAHRLRHGGLIAIRQGRFDLELTAGVDAAEAVVLAVASGAMDRETFTRWVMDNHRPLPVG
jgi:hypothetical protein